MLIFLVQNFFFITSSFNKHVNISALYTPILTIERKKLAANTEICLVCVIQHNKICMKCY